jgi:hypothetical protein
MTKWKECGRNRTWPDLKHYPSICLEELGKTTTKLSRNSSLAEI